MSAGAEYASEKKYRRNFGDGIFPLLFRSGIFLDNKREKCYNKNIYANKARDCFDNILQFWREYVR